MKSFHSCSPRLCMATRKHHPTRSCRINHLHCRQLQVAKYGSIQINTACYRILPVFLKQIVVSTATQNLTKGPNKEPKHQQAIAANFLSGDDFPLLGAEVNVTKDQMRKMKAAAQSEGKSPVFKDSYHAQLREFHGDNMRAVESVEQDEELKGRRVRVLDNETVNSLMGDVIRELAAEGELVTKEKVRSKRKHRNLKGIVRHIGKYATLL